MALNLRFVNQTGLPDDQVFITFQNPSKGTTNFGVTYGSGTAVAFSTSDAIMSESLSLQTIGPDGLSVAQLVGGIVFVSYGKALTATTSVPSFIGPTGPDYRTAFQPFELTMNGGEGDQGDMTAINYFTAPMAIASFSGGPSGTRLQSVGFAASTATIAKQLAALTNDSSASVIRDEQNKVVRYIGPSSFGPCDDDPFPSLLPYLQQIAKDGQPTTISNGNAFNVPPSGGMGSTNYDFTLALTATVAEDGTITMSGSITTMVTPFGGASSAGPTFDDATVTFSASDVDKLDTVLYGQANVDGVVTFGSGWTALGAYIAQQGIDAGALGITQSLAIGEITSGLLMGFVNSSVVPPGSTMPLGDMPSKQWWALDPMIAFSKVQSNPAFYNQYAGVLFDASNNDVYSIPFSDRMGSGPLVNSVSFNGTAVDTWVVTLLPPVSTVASNG